MMALRFIDVSVIYGEGTPFRKVALDSISVDFPAGQVIGIIGHTGSGKSTMVMLSNGILKPTSGKILLEETDIWEKPREIGRVRAKVGIAFQYPEYQLFDETVYKDIAFGPKNMGLEESEIDARVRKSLPSSFREVKNVVPLLPGLSPWIPKCWCLMNLLPVSTLSGERKYSAD